MQVIEAPGARLAVIWQFSVRGFVVTHRERTTQGHIPAVGNQITVADDRTHRAVGSGGCRLDNGQCGHLDRSDCLTVRLGVGRAISGVRRVGHLASIQVTLRHCVGSCAGDRAKRSSTG